MTDFPNYSGADLSIDEVGFSESCLKGLKRIGITKVGEIFEMAERFHDYEMGLLIHGASLRAYDEAVKHLHSMNLWPWPEDLDRFEND